MKTEATHKEIQDFVERSQVCYEVWPEYLSVRGKPSMVGFQLELVSAAPHKGEHRFPALDENRRTFAELRKLAEWIMPPEGRPSRYEIGPPDGALRYAPRRGFRPEVSLTIRIPHRHGFDQPVDECEKRCLKEMRERLAALGIREGRWHRDLVRSK